MSKQNKNLIDPDAFKQAKAMLNHKFNRILSYYFEDTEAYIATIQSGLDTKDAGLVTPAAHTIKSSSKQLGAVTLAMMAASIEETARNYLKDGGDFDDLIAKCISLEAVFVQTKEIMQELSNK